MHIVCHILNSTRIILYSNHDRNEVVCVECIDWSTRENLSHTYSTENNTPLDFYFVIQKMIKQFFCCVFVSKKLCLFFPVLIKFKQHVLLNYDFDLLKENISCETTWDLLRLRGNLGGRYKGFSVSELREKDFRRPVNIGGLYSLYKCQEIHKRSKFGILLDMGIWFLS